MENLALLRDPRSGVDVALVPGGSVGKTTGGLESLGTLFYEPLWIFHRGGLEGATLAALRGRKVSIGPVGSGSHALLLRLLKRNDLVQDVGKLLALPPQEAADKLLAGEIDAAALLSSLRLLGGKRGHQLAESSVCSAHRRCGARPRTTRP